MTTPEVPTDIIFAFDGTGSMYPCLREVTRNIEKVGKQLFDEIQHLRIGVIAFGDFEGSGTRAKPRTLDDFMKEERRYAELPFTTDVKEIHSFLKEQREKEPGDGEWPAEAYEVAMYGALHYDWRSDDNGARCLVLIGDTFPREKDHPYDLKWKELTEQLEEKRVSIFGIQCLDTGGQKATDFFRYVSNKTNGYHLRLDQFQYIKDIMVAVAYHQADQALLEEFEVELERTRGGLTASMRQMFDVMTGRRTRAEVQEEQDTRQQRYNYRRLDDESSQESDDDDNTGPVDPSQLQPCPPSRFQVFTVEQDTSIKDFAASMGLTFKKGRGFYEFTKSEIVQPQKQIVLMHRQTGDLYQGSVARRLAGIPRNQGKKRLSPSSVPDYRVFIQSTSANRKLIANQGFLYEVEEETQ